MVGMRAFPNADDIAILVASQGVAPKANSTSILSDRLCSSSSNSEDASDIPESALLISIPPRGMTIRGEYHGDDLTTPNTARESVVTTPMPNPNRESR
jgi:hypothetical protein